MKDAWYGDNKDLVKWSILAQLATKYKTPRIVYAAYYRPSVWSPLDIDGHPYRIPVGVITHFRDIHKITTMNAGLQINLIGNVFANRAQYTQGIIGAIGAPGTGPCIVFLDPDIGLEPGRPRPEHVLVSEVSAVWNAMRPYDLLSFFQHRTNRKGAPWIGAKRKQLAGAIGLSPSAVKVAKGPRIAPDVVLFYCQKRVLKRNQRSITNQQAIAGEG